MLPPAITASMKEARKGRFVFLTPTFSTASLISAGLYAFELKMGGCGADARSAMPYLPCLTTHLAGAAANHQEAYDLRCDHFHQRHGGKDHGVADVRPFGGRHLGRIDENRRVS